MTQEWNGLEVPFTDVLQNNCFQKFRNIHRKTPVSESLFNKSFINDTGVSC